jgi:diacylglycerol O-acyltransferase
MERLSGLDAFFLYTETPQVQMHVQFVALVDPKDVPGGYSFSKLSETVADKVRRKAAFRRRLMHVPLDLHHPLWIEDPDFDIIHHVRQVALPQPGTMVELGAMVGRISSTPLDRSRALWELWAIEGVENDRIAIVLKFHHAFVDGVSGAALLMHLMDTQRVPQKLPPPEPIKYETLPSEWSLAAFALRSRLKQPSELIRVATASVRAVVDIAEKRKDPAHIEGGTPLVAPHTHFNQSVTARRNVAFSRIALDDVKEVKNAFGTTVNDVVIAVAGGALRRYLEGRGALPNEPLTAVCPISVRPKEREHESNNLVSAMWTHLGTHHADPIERLKSINAVTRGAKDEHRAIGAKMLQDWAELAAPSTFSTAVRLYSRMQLASKHRPLHNLVLSNVPGPRFPLYFAGAKVESIYPIGPVMEGSGLNLTVMSYLESVDFSFHVDPSLVPDAWDLAGFIATSMRELRDAARAFMAAGGPAGAASTRSTV